MPELQDRVIIDELPEPYRGIAHSIGLDAALKVAEILGGQHVYFPLMGLRILRKMRDAEIKKEYTGYNTRDLAQRHGLSDRQVRRIAKARR